LIEEDYIRQKEGATDRRQRLLFITPKGEALASRLSRLQSGRLARAVNVLPAEHHDMVRRFLIAMLDPDRRDDVLHLIYHGDRAHRSER
jgi:DNA-binding MarR family transcriptional regulator